MQSFFKRPGAHYQGDLIKEIKLCIDIDTTGGDIGQ